MSENGLVVAAPAAEEPSLPGLTAPSRRDGVKRRLGDVVVHLGFADREEVEEVVERRRGTSTPLGRALVGSGAIDARQLARALAERNGLHHVDLDRFEVDKGAANLLSAGKARRYRSLPIAFLDDRTLLVATADPSNVLAMDDIVMVTGYEVRRAVASPEEIDAVIDRLSQLETSVEEVDELEESRGDDGEVIDLRESAEDGPVVKLAHSIIADAVRRGASDVHLEPSATDMRVRMRVDGVVFHSTTVPRRFVPGLVSRVKIMAQLDIAERRVPQDGRIGLSVEGRSVDLRVATLPVVRGESVVLRILDKGRAMVDLDALGMEPGDRERLERSIHSTSGAILATGPTGSGKTTTLYAALGEVNAPERTLLTIEDPVEYELDGVKQVQVNPRAGVSFARGLRAMVRADPDVIMVGEVRDRETAQIAIESALTGHLVLSTLHANDAPLATARLIEMGMEPFLVASGVRCVVAQRLVRRLCECRGEVELSREALADSGFEASSGFQGFEPHGCVRCGGTGYRGRIGLYEVMPLSEPLRRLVLEGAPAEAIRDAARREGMRTLREDGLEKIRQGITSVPEVLRSLGADA